MLLSCISQSRATPLGRSRYHTCVLGLKAPERDPPTESTLAKLAATAAQLLEVRHNHSVPMMYSKRHLPDIEQWSQSSGSNVIPRRARPDLAGLRPHSFGIESTRTSVTFSVGTPLCAYGVAYGRVDELSTSGREVPARVARRECGPAEIAGPSDLEEQGIRGGLVFKAHRLLYH